MTGGVSGGGRQDNSGPSVVTGRLTGQLTGRVTATGTETVIIHVADRSRSYLRTDWRP